MSPLPPLRGQGTNTFVGLLKKGTNTLENDDWKSCKDCGTSFVVAENVVIRSEQFDKMKRMGQPELVSDLVERASHKNGWVTLEYKIRRCEFDNNLCLPDDVWHHCPWHGIEPEKETWWE